MPYKDPEKRREYEMRPERRYRKRHRPGNNAAFLKRHPGYAKDYAREWRKDHPEYSVLQRRLHLTETLARQAVSKAKRNGSLTPLPCEVCGSAKVEAHHAFGYEEPVALAVWWLCRTHHLAIHVAIRAQ